MKICIMHFAFRLLSKKLVQKFIQKFLYGVLLVISRCCFHNLVENSILYIGPILFHKVKSYGR